MELFVGELQYYSMEPPFLEVTGDGHARIRTPQKPVLRTAPAGTYVVLTTPYEGGDARASQRTLDAAEGLLRARWGAAVVYRSVFENVFDLYTGQVVLHFAGVDDPSFPDVPAVDDSEVRDLDALAGAIGGLTGEAGTRVALALRWLAMAGRERGVDALLKYWIAIETLALPDGDTNVRHAETLLEAGYGLDKVAVRERFGLGRLQGMRSAIVHNGARVRFPGEVGKFLEALFLDLLHVWLGLPCPRRAAELETQGEFTWTDWLRDPGQAAS